MTSKIGNAIGVLVLAGVFSTGGWIGHSMWMGVQAKKGAAVQAAIRAAMAGAAQTVAVTEVKEMEYNAPEKSVAHAEAVAEVDLLPQVDGYIKEIKFKEGDVVKEGQLLYVLDDEKYTAVVGQAKADLNAAETEERRAKRYYERMKNADERGITQKERDDAEAAADKAVAAVMQAKANLVVAEYNCKKAKIYAPISGQIGKTTAHIGDYVAPSKGALAHIMQIDPIRVTFPMTDRAFVDRVQAVKQGNADEYSMRLILPNGTDYGQRGQLDFDDNAMSKETASLMMRVSFPNPDRMLVPNMYVTLVTEFAKPPMYLSVPHTAIVDLAVGGVGAYVLKDDMTVELRPVSVKPMVNGFIPVTKGLSAGEKVVTSGTRKLRDGAKVVLAEATPNEENTPGWKGKAL